MPRFAWAIRSRRRANWSLVSLFLASSAAGLLLAPSLVLAQTSSPDVHVVQDGETLLQIALNAHTDVATIAALNNLGDTNVLAIGQSLKLPAAASAATSTAAAAVPAAASATAAAATARPQGGGSYTVAEGDTLWDIAQRSGTTADAIVQLNQLDDPNHLTLGTALSLPASSPSRSTAAAVAPTATPSPAAAAAPASAGAAAPAAAAAAPSKRNLLVSYTVQPGETLSQIAHQFAVRPDVIIQATKLDDPNRIAVGSVLQVPVPAREHVVSAGETLRDIAAAEKVDLGSLIDFNQLDDPALIRVGQTLLVPVAGSSPAPDTVQAAAAPTAAPSATPKPSPSPSPQASASPPTATATPTPRATPSASSSASASASPTPSASATPSSKPAAPLAVVAPPAGAPTDGMVGIGLKLLGSAYVWGGSSPSSGFDCSGFVWYVAHQGGKQISRGMFAQYNSGSHPSRDQLQVGDVVFFQNTFRDGLSHNGIYIGNNQFVHAADESAGVTVSSLNTEYWKSHWFGATRLP